MLVRVLFERARRAVAAVAGAVHLGGRGARRLDAAQASGGHVRPKKQSSSPELRRTCLRREEDRSSQELRYGHAAGRDNSHARRCEGKAASTRRLPKGLSQSHREKNQCGRRRRFAALAKRFRACCCASPFSHETTNPHRSHRRRRPNRLFTPVPHRVRRDLRAASAGHSAPHRNRARAAGARRRGDGTR